MDKINTGLALIALTALTAFALEMRFVGELVTHNINFPLTSIGVGVWCYGAYLIRTGAKELKR